LCDSSCRRLYCLSLALTARPLPDPASFKVELYPGFAGHGFVEGMALRFCTAVFWKLRQRPVIENGFRSVAAKCGQDGAELVNLLLPLTVFFRQYAKAASDSLPGEGFVVVDNLIDVLCRLWRAALSCAEAAPDLLNQVRRFREASINELEMYG
jgi:hypothetical protein